MKTLLFLFLLVFTAPAWGVENIPLTPQVKKSLFNDLSSKLACLCGCGSTVKSCPHEQCSFAVPVRKEIQQMIDTRLAYDEITARLVSARGEAILALPAFRGFNIMAWVVPFAVILLVGYAVAVLIRNWSSRRRTAETEANTVSKVRENDPYLKKMRRELEKFED